VRFSLDGRVAGGAVALSSDQAGIDVTVRTPDPVPLEFELGALPDGRWVLVLVGRLRAALQMPREEGF
jgi:hypothetical protein